MKVSRRTLGLIILVGLLIPIGVHVFLLKVWNRCDGECYQINQTYEFGVGSHPRMTQVDDLLLVAYYNGSFVLDGINLTTTARIGPEVIISNGINPERPMLYYSQDLGILICVFNHDDAASCGIAWVPKSQILNSSAWNVQYSIVGPVYKDFFHIGLWEPYLAPYNSTTFLLYVSNQTLYDPEHPIDVEHYSYTLEGYEVVQKTEIYWTNWNGTGFETSHCGVASQTLAGDPIHHKDGMASSVLIAGNATHKDYLMTFEAFAPPAKIPRITMVKLQISPAGVQTLWRREITHFFETAPIITSLNGTFITSFKHHPFIDQDNIGFIGLKADQTTYSKPIYLNSDLFGWPSVAVVDDQRLWVTGTNRTTGKVAFFEINLELFWEDHAFPHSIVLFHQVVALFLLFLSSLFLFNQSIFHPKPFFKNLTTQKITPSSFLPIASFTLLSGFGFASFTHFESFDLMFSIACALVLFLWIYYGCFSYLLGRLLKLNARFFKTLVFTQYFFIPLMMFFLALNAVLTLFGPEILWTYIFFALANPFAFIIAGIIVGIFLAWFIFLARIGISTNFETSLRKTGLIFLIPILLLILLLYWLVSTYLLTLIPL